jgi:hypothetical protein
MDHAPRTEPPVLARARVGVQPGLCKVAHVLEQRQRIVVLDVDIGEGVFQQTDSLKADNW